MNLKLKIVLLVLVTLASNVFCVWYAAYRGELRDLLIWMAIAVPILLAFAVFVILPIRRAGDRAVAEIRRIKEELPDAQG